MSISEYELAGVGLKTGYCSKCNQWGLLANAGRGMTEFVGVCAAGCERLSKPTVSRVTNSVIEAACERAQAERDLQCR